MLFLYAEAHSTHAERCVRVQLQQFALLFPPYANLVHTKSAVETSSDPRLCIQTASY
jgi:hypothetical protein